MKLKAGGMVNRKRGYIYFKHLSFLKKVVKPTTRSSEKISPSEMEVLKNVIDTEDSGPPLEDPLDDMDYEGSSSKIIDDTFQETCNVYNTLPDGLNEEDFRLTPAPESKTVANGNFMTNFNQPSTSHAAKPVQNHDMLFLMSLAPEFEKISDEHKLKTKIELMEVLIKAQKKLVKNKQNVTTQQQHRSIKQQHPKVNIKDEAESESYEEDIDEHSLDSIRDPTTPELLEDDNVPWN